MQRQLVRTLYRHRHWLKRLIVWRRPIPINLSDFKLYIRLDDWAVGARIAIKRRYEPHVSHMIRSLLQPGAVFVDIGANIGYYSMLGASRVGTTGRVIAFEPSQANCDLLNLSQQHNHFSQIELHRCAVAEIDGVVGFGMDDSNGQIVDASRAQFQVEAVRLDTILAGAECVDLIKMDVEGGEGRALAGMYETLRRFQPTLICEFTPAALPRVSGITPSDYLDQLRDLGYALHLIEPNGSAKALDNAAILALFEGTTLDHVDLVCYPQAKA